MNFDTPTPVLGFEQRPSYWFTCHAPLLAPGARVLDFACGAGRHAMAAAQLGASVVAVDRDRAKLALAKAEGQRRGLSIDWIEADLEKTWPSFGQFDAILVFNYLDRDRMPDLVTLLKPGGLLIFETFLEVQRQLGWGPEKEAHLLKYGEAAGLVAPLRVIFGREAFEPADNSQWAAVASVVARQTK